jgi:hypothetical protein
MPRRVAGAVDSYSDVCHETAKRRKADYRYAPLAATAAACALLAACGGRTSDTPVLAAQPAASAQAAQTGAAIPHGDHNPRHGGIVMMNGDVHFEVVLARDGHHRVYFSDATRSELPAATASGVTISVTAKGKPPEAVALHIDDTGESWVGAGRPVDDPAASARVAYTAYGKPYFIDVPFPH